MKYTSLQGSVLFLVLKFGDWDYDATDLVKWIILTDQWPFLMSCLLHHMQDVQVYK